MTNCTDCRYQENMCKWPCDDCVKGDKWEERPLTNADKIRTMTNEELASFLFNLQLEAVAITMTPYDNFLNWLKQEVQDERN